MKVKRRLFANTVAAGLMACLLSGLPARAGLVLSIESSTAAPGSNGSFDVLLTNTGPGTVNVAAFNFTLFTPNPSVTFTDVTTATTAAPYIFPSSLFGPDTTTTASGQTVEAGDLDATGNGTSVSAGQTYGLGDVFYQVAAATPTGTSAIVSFEAYPDTSLSDADGDNLAFTVTSGTITVIPEPAFGWLTGAVLAAAAGLSWRRGNRGRA